MSTTTAPVRRAGLTLLAVAALLTPLVVGASPAQAAVSVSRAELDRGSLRIEGRALANRPITVDGVAMGTSDGSGSFRVSRSSYPAPADCTVDVNDGSATAASARLSGCTVTTPPPAPTAVILPDVAELGPGFVGADFNPGSQWTVNVAGATGPVRWDVVAGALPDGLAVVVPEPAGRPSPVEGDTSMQVEGIPTTVQTSTFTLRATDANGLTATRTYTIRINPPVALGIAPQPWPPLTEGQFANLWVDGSGGVLPYRWSVAAGALPPGTALIQDAPDSRLVRVGGTPTAPGSSTWTLRLTDATGTSAERTLSVTVAPGAATAPTLVSLTLAPSTVTGGDPATGTLTLDAPAPTGGAYVPLLTTDVQTTRPPASVTIPAGATTASFTVTTTAVTTSRTTSISGTYAGVTRAADLTLTPPAGTPQPAAPLVTGLTLGPDTVTGGTPTSGVVTLDAAAPAGGTVVSLTSSSPQLAAVPTTVVVPAGSTTAPFSVTTTPVAASITVGITAASGGVARVVALTLTPAPAATGDTVTISRAQYDSGKRQLRVEATSSATGATLRVHVTSTNALIGTLAGGSGQFSVANPQSITVRSSLGGVATRTVTTR